MVLERVIKGKLGAFFIDGPGGTGKTYLYRAILAVVRLKGFIALATATLGVAASFLPGGRTAHSQFKIPVKAEENITCAISKQSGTARLLREVKIIIWDEALMSKRQTMEAFQEMLQDIMDNGSQFGGKVIVFGSDFRQVLPVVPKGTSQKTINTSLVKSDLWPSLEKLKLTENVRAKFDQSFCDYLLRIGDGIETVIIDDKIKLPPFMIIP
ncbi:uncharacterized protein LOC136067557 [Quercus suber]|uniref:uncharacterized protein LOC112001470 n=1 Tax=Quercus suber TaxID=58331 RepID=UPI0032DECCF5